MLAKFANRLRRQLRIRAKISGSAVRPRLSVYRSNANIYAQLIDLQNINYEKNKDNLKFKLEVEKNQISIDKLSEDNKILSDENNKLREDVLFYEKMLGKKRK